MKYSHQIFLLTTGILIMMVMREPSPFQNRPNPHKQLMEERPYDERYKIRLEIVNNQDNQIADILWLRKVARFCLKQGISGFNVIEEKIYPNSIEGTIELEQDRMKAQYDSYEILQLEIPEIYAQ